MCDQSHLLAYPPEILSHWSTDAEGTQAQPIVRAQTALVHWNAYLTAHWNDHKEAFLTQACWLLAHETRLSTDTGGWLLPAGTSPGSPASPDVTGSMLSAVAQGCGLSVLVRAYQLTGQAVFLQAARRIVATFELDILDGGIQTPIGEAGLFFETCAVYPATHLLAGHLLALLSLIDYEAITHDQSTDLLLQRGLAALDALLPEFDTGYWTYPGLLQRQLASRREHAGHIQLLASLARVAARPHLAHVATRWQRYSQQTSSRFRCLCTRALTGIRTQGLQLIRAGLATQPVSMVGAGVAEPVCVPISAFPVPGGVRSVLACVASVMEPYWQLRYLTNYKGAETGSLAIETFGHRRTSPWHFPSVWRYVYSGSYHLLQLLSHRPQCRLVLPQDGIFTGAFAGIVGKLLGLRVVCMDHGNVTWLEHPTLRQERLNTFAGSPLPRRLLAHVQSACYWPSLRLLAWIAVSCSDHFLVAGDEVEAAYREQLGVPLSRITRYAYMVDSGRFTPPTSAARTQMRMQQSLPEAALVITLISRLSPEKGLAFALAGIAQALAALPPAIRQRVRVLIAGNGPLYSQVLADIERYGLQEVCTFWGEAHPEDVVMLLGISDIFLYSGTRGTNYSMAVLEAMAAACAVVASTSPQSNAKLLAEGRGIAIESGSADAIEAALTQLCLQPELCAAMGQRARTYVTKYHGSSMLQRTLLRSSNFIPTHVEVVCPLAAKVLS